MNDVLDEIDRAILSCLTQDARVSLKVLSARVGLTSPSTAERVKRLEERGVIQGYGARVNLAALGYSLQALGGSGRCLGCCRRWINISRRCRNVLKVTR
ncbi:transcriptional regulator AsnC family [Klebsiella pneumoniae]|nr:transcriptional regulator AsnC family [Klebsiella pneumoniae]